MSSTGRFFVKVGGRTFCVEPIDNDQGKGSKRWGGIKPKELGSITEDESIIREKNGFKNILMLPPGTSPLGYINNLIDNGKEIEKNNGS